MRRPMIRHWPSNWRAPVTTVFSRPTARRAVRVLALIILAAGAVAFCQPDRAAATLLGDRRLEPPCCNGDTLNGTSASINASSINPDTQSCIAYRSDAERYQVGLLQVGLVRCGTGANVDGTCSLSNNLVKYVEKLVGTNPGVCVAHGGASTGTSYWMSVQNATGNLWYSYIDGTAYESNTFQQSKLVEGVEYTGSFCSGWSGSVTYAADSNHRWQRYVINSPTWVTVQTSFIDNTSSCFSMSGGPPTSFTISR